MIINIPESKMSQIALFRKEEKEIQEYLNSPEYENKAWVDFNRPNVSLEGVATIGKSMDEIIGLVTEYFERQNSPALTPLVMAMGGQCLYASLMKFVQSYFIERHDVEDFHEAFNNFAFVKDDSKLRWKSVEVNRVQGKYCVSMVCTRIVNDISPTKSDPILTISGDIFITAYGGKGYLRFGGLTIQTFGTNIIRFSKNPIDYESQKKVELLRTLPLKPFIEDSKLANLSPVKSRAFQYLETFRASSSLLNEGYGIKQKIMSDLYDDCAISISRKAIQVYNDKDIWQRFNEQLDFPRPIIMEKLISELRADPKYYTEDKIPNCALTFMEYAETKTGEYKGTNLVWFICQGANKEKFLQKLIPFTKNTKHAIATIRENTLKYDSACTGEGQYQGATPMLLCAQHNLEEEVRFLISKGKADIQASFTHPDSPWYQENALFYALNNESWALAEFLLRKGISVENLNLTKGYSFADHIIYKLVKNQKWDLLEKIMDAISDIGNKMKLIPGCSGYPLYFAALNAEWGIFKKLLEQHDMYSNNITLDFKNGYLHKGNEKRKGLSVMQMIMSDISSGVLDVETTLSFLTALFDLRQKNIDEVKISHFKVLARNQQPQEMLKSASEEELSTVEYKSYCTHMHRKFPSDHAYGDLSALLALSSLNSVVYSTLDNVRFLLIKELFNDYQDESQLSQAIRVNDYLRGINLKGYQFSLPAFAAQCRQYDFLKELYDTGVSANLSWFDKRTSDYSKVESRLYEFYKAPFKVLLTTLDALRHFDAIMLLLEFTGSEFDMFFTIPSNKQRLLFLANLLEDNHLISYLESQGVKLALPQVGALEQPLKEKYQSIFEGWAVLNRCQVPALLLSRAASTIESPGIISEDAPLIQERRNSLILK